MRSLVLSMMFATSLEAQRRLEKVASTAGDDQMGAPTGIAVGRNGEIFIADYSHLNIAVYDSSGERIRTIGRNGEGPGEFRRINGIAWLADTLVVYDRLLSRVTLLRPDGKVVRTSPWRASEIPSQLLGPGGPKLAILAYGRGKPVPMRAPLNGTTTIRPPKTFYELSSDGSLATISLPTMAPDSIISHTCYVDPKASIHWTDNEPGGQGPFNAFTSRGEVVYASDDRTKVLWRRGATETKLSYAPVAVTEAMWRRETAEHLELEKKIGKFTCTPELHRPATMSPIRGLIADDAGGVWVEITTQSGSRFDVYDASGKLIASVDAPVQRLQTVPVVVRGARIYLPVKNADDVVSYSVYQLRR